MPTPPKPTLVLMNEKKSHRTKAEINKRKEAEKALTSGVSLKERQEVKDNPIAHREFLRINKLLKGIEKNDALYEPIINRYCMIQAECFDLESKREEIYRLSKELKDAFYQMTFDMDNIDEAPLLLEFNKDISKLIVTMLNIDKQIQTKRKMLLDIEKENIMTVASALRSIPKKIDESANPLLAALGK